MEQPIEYDELNELLQICGSSWNAGQVHGLLCGQLSIGGAEGASRWFAQVLGEADPRHAQRGACEVLLDGLSALTWRQLVERQSDFVLLLPHDDESLALRTAAMGLWCEGFLHGLVSEKQNAALKERLAADPIADIIKDMVQVTQAIAEDDDSESDEASFFEVNEYLRVAVQLIYEELSEFRGPEDDVVADDAATLH